EDGVGAAAVVADAVAAVAQAGRGVLQVGERVGGEAALVGPEPGLDLAGEGGGGLGGGGDEVEGVAELVGNGRHHLAQGGELGFHHQLHAGHGLALQAAVERGVLQGDGGLAGEGQEQLQVVLGEGGGGAPAVDVEDTDDFVLRLERRAHGGD